MYEVYGSITKKSLLDKANLIKERFNNANFKTKSTDSIQCINKVEVVDYGMAVYFWCSRMNNFVVSAGTKKQTYKRLSELLMYICDLEHEDHIDISDFIVNS